MTPASKDLLRIAIFTCGVALLLQVLSSGVALNFVMMALYAALLAQAWNILGGFGGQFSFGHALFFGTGAYVQAIAQLRWGWSPWLALPVGVAVSAAVGGWVGALSFRYGLKGSYFALVTLAFAEVFRIMATTVPFTGAGVGLMVPLREGFANMQFGSRRGYAMLALATADEPQMLISTIELDAPTRPYTIETLGQLQAQHSAAQLFFVMGMDSFRDVPLWREHERLLSEYNIIVAARPGALASDPKDSAAHLAPALQARVVNLRGGLRPQENDLREPHIFVTDYVAVDVSATEIRQAAQAGEPLDMFTPPAVAAYIAKYQLYQLAE